MVVLPVHQERRGVGREERLAERHGGRARPRRPGRGSWSTSQRGQASVSKADGIAPTTSPSCSARSSPCPSPPRPPPTPAPSGRRPPRLTPPSRPHHGDHPLLALRDHDLPRLEVVLTERHAVELDVDAGAVAPSRRATTRGPPRRSPAVTRRARPRPAPRSPRRASAREGSPIWTDGRLSGSSSPSSWLASTLAPPMPSRPVVAPNSSTALPAPAARARVTRSAGKSRRTSR